jgi:hypothetical protein
VRATLEQMRGPGWLKPSLGDLVAASLVGWLFVAGHGWSSLLADGDTGWHIRAGDWILSNQSVPRLDLFAFSRPGEPWYAWEWLADVVFSLAHGAGGLAGVTVLAGSVLTLAVLVVFGHALWRGSHALVALAVTLAAAGAGSMHFLARPHVFSLLLLPVSLWLVERDRRRPGRTVWCLVPLAAVWVILHGGFFALPASLALLAAGLALEAALGRAGWASCRRYAALAAATLAASFANPYGAGLHVHVARYVTSDWIRNSVDEFQSPRFRSENLLHFELLLVAGLLVAGWWVSRRRVADALLVAGWAHLALASVRHVPLFALVAAPLLAGSLSEILGAWAGGARSGSAKRILWDLGGELRPGFRRFSLWGPALAAAVMLATPASRWPGDFPDAKFPVSLIRACREHLQGRRIFTSDQWGDYLIYRYWPSLRLFIDGRSDFYGPQLGGEYLALVDGREGWQTVLRKYEFRAVLAARSWPLARLLDGDPGWRRIAGDGLAALYVPAAGAPPPLPNALPEPGR